MAQVMSLYPSLRSSIRTESLRRLDFLVSTPFVSQNADWSSLLQSLKCNGGIRCFFSDQNRRQEQARKALEGALGGKKNEFEKWNREIERKEKSGSSGDAGGGGWFGGGGGDGWFGWANNQPFWNDAQQTGLTLLGILLIYLIVAKGEVMLAVVVNPLLYGLRGTRDGFTSLPSRIMGNKPREASADSNGKSEKERYDRVSSKESVVRKWGGQ